MRLSVARHLPTRRQIASCWPYLGAAVAYVAIGVFLTDFMLSVFTAIGYLLVVVWLVPLAIRKLR